MAASNKKSTSSKSAMTPAKAVAKAISTPVRNTAVPPKVAAAPARKTITRDQIAVRAFEIYASGKGGSESDNWFRAEQELRGI